MLILLDTRKEITINPPIEFDWFEFPFRENYVQVIKTIHQSRVKILTKTVRIWTNYMTKLPVILRIWHIWSKIIFFHTQWTSKHTYRGKSHLFCIVHQVKMITPSSAQQCLPIALNSYAFQNSTKVVTNGQSLKTFICNQWEISESSLRLNFMYLNKLKRENRKHAFILKNNLLLKDIGFAQMMSAEGCSYGLFIGG